MPSVLIVGATRGLGAALVNHYAAKSTDVYATSRSLKEPSSPSAENIHWVTGIDLAKQSCGSDLATSLKGARIDTVIITAGYFAKEAFGDSSWQDEIKMYTTSAIAPVFVVEALVKSQAVTDGAKIILVSSESGSITLRHEQEGGGNFGHHGSKAATNMVGKQLSFDLKDKEIAVGMVHPSFMRTEMTKNVGFDKYWDAGGALKPEEAAEIVANWVDNEFSMDLTGTYWAPRGTRDIGNWEAVMGKGKAKEGPVQLPW